MMELRLVTWELVQSYFVDFQKKAHCYELPPDDATYLGIYLDNVLVGYFILQEYDDTLEINQGYLKPIARHKQLSYASMKLLQTNAKASGFKQIVLKASRTLKAYTKFMTNLGFKQESITYSKVI